MALRKNTLKCIYKLAGTVHQVDTSQLTTSSVETVGFDRVIFRRYQQGQISPVSTVIEAEVTAVFRSKRAEFTKMLRWTSQ